MGHSVEVREGEDTLARVYFLSHTNWVWQNISTCVCATGCHGKSRDATAYRGVLQHHLLSVGVGLYVRRTMLRHGIIFCYDAYH